MAVSKRLRYEILRRDNHTCRYCGATAPDAKLTVDHVTPRALGGSDEPANLVTACGPCNTGKTSTNPDAPLVADVAADAVRWAAARTRAIVKWRDHREALDVGAAAFAEAWDAWGAGEGDDRRTVPRESTWQDSLERWLDEGFEIRDLIGLIPKAMRAHNGNGNPIPFGERWRYYCGVVWRTLDNIQKETSVGVETDSDDDGTLTAVDEAIDEAWHAGFDLGRNVGHQAAFQDLGFTVWEPPPPSEPCQRCNANDQYGTTGLCTTCWQVELEVNA